ncbi:glycosyltransferase family 4 protein [Alcanivorax marinus]|uniref:Glycosyltransferase family 4 protein n=1 Tax=Alloalcanivorax marinus TaxID=1177169 RepID=A0A9Q3YN81_9GAMM|nr:glycosyltransferase family 4 protein [Alloalcanivorax marinus]MCC4309527.1 glycosyltransferase family 4 protein [Alloalcanivorax marinus]
MRLTFVVGDISAYGGTERVTIEIASAFAQAGHEVTILSLFGQAHPWFDVPEVINIRSASIARFRNRLVRAVFVSWSIRREVKKSSVDAVILVDSILFAFCLPWLVFRSTKIVCWEHFNLSTNHGSRLRDFGRWAASRWSDKIVALTEGDAKAWKKKYGINDRVQTIGNPIPRFSEGGWAHSGASERSLVVLAVGRLSYEKGFDILLRAWSLIEKRDGWTLRIVGGGQEDAALKELANELAISDSVSFAGQVRDIANEYRAASLYVLSSRWEGFSMTLLEAQHFGLPSISTDCPTGPREVLSGGGGRLVDPENPQALAHGMAELMSDSTQRDSLASAAKLNANRYRPESIIQVWGLMFEKLGIR